MEKHSHTRTRAMSRGGVNVMCVRILNVTTSRSPSTALCHSTQYEDVFFLPAKQEIHCQLTVVQFVALFLFLFGLTALREVIKKPTKLSVSDSCRSQGTP